MSLVDRVYRIPARLDQKGVFTEVTYVISYLKSEKKFLDRSFDLVTAVERFYRSSAQAFIATVDVKSPIPLDLPLTSGFVAFGQIRLNHCDRLLEIAQRIAAMLSTEFTHLRTSFDTSSKQVKIELKNLQTIVQAPLDNLYASLSGYDKYFKQLQQCYMNPGQAGKAVKNLDEKLARVQNNYAVYHRRFVDYVSARDPIFASVESLVRGTNITLNDLFRILSDIDGIAIGDLADAPALRLSARRESDAAAAPPEMPEMWIEEEEEGETPFTVKLAQPLLVGGVSLPINYPFTVVDSRGRMWTLKDRAGKNWTIPQMYLTPEVKTRRQSTTDK
jgi:hypothetical protein